MLLRVSENGSLRSVLGEEDIVLVLWIKGMKGFKLDAERNVIILAL